ncbi:MAG: LysR family transcriptional regulator [Gammaproteobacteria bacterium]|nr:MAG: LysR family transcriptional regulator [Gammaproteobacteria bacterium]UCH41282.1 MAG: LysR family transcriptional regulator [Gammaproteobacteria bacterium]
MSKFDIESMRALATIAETGGITRAAKKLNLSQSAVSHKIKRLERRLNRSLFTRIDGKIGFSRDGEKLLDYARRMVRLHDEAWASFHQSDLSGELRLGITEDITAPDMALILSNFSNSFPNVALTSRVAHTPELVGWLDRGEIDMALIEVFESQLLDDDYPLGRQQVVWLQAEDFILDDGPIPYVTYHRDCFYQAWAEQALAKINRSLRVVFECPSLDGMVNAVRNGLGIGLVNYNVFEQRQAGRRGEGMGLTFERNLLPQPPPIQHVARFSAGMPTQQMDKLLELIKQELIPVS